MNMFQHKDELADGSWGPGVRENARPLGSGSDPKVVHTSSRSLLHGSLWAGRLLALSQGALTSISVNSHNHPMGRSHGSSWWMGKQECQN